MSMALTRAKKLRLAHRDLRAIAFGMGPTRRLSMVGFAHGVLAHYLNRRAQVSAPELALGRLRPRVTIRNAWRHAHIHLAPRLSLAVLGWKGQSLNRSGAGPLTLGLCVEQQRLTHAQRPRPTVSIKPVTIENLATRLIAKGGRVESVQENAPGNSRRAKAVVIDGAAPARLSASAPAPVEKVVRRSKAVETERNISSRSVEVASAEPRGKTKVINPWQQSNGVAIDVNRLTDQVIQAIDQRIVAQRERMGQHNWRS
jgi:hypothetical protein